LITAWKHQEIENVRESPHQPNVVYTPSWKAFFGFSGLHKSREYNSPMHSRKATVNGKNVLVLTHTLHAVGRDRVHEVVIAGQQDFAIGTKVTVTFEIQTIVGKISAVSPGTENTTIWIACRRKK
jgi:hypothetical protein